MYSCTLRYILLTRLELHSFSQALIRDKLLKNTITRFLKLSKRESCFYKGQLIHSYPHTCPLHCPLPALVYW
jgi:hypothetical protein